MSNVLINTFLKTFSAALKCFNQGFTFNRFLSIIKSDAKLLQSMLHTGMYKKFTCLDTKVNFEWPLNILCSVEKIS